MTLPAGIDPTRIRVGPDTGPDDEAQEVKVRPLEVSEAKRLKGLESENAKLKKLADTMLDNAASKDLLAKKGDARREARGSRSFAFRVGNERPAGVQDHRLRADDGALSMAPG
jgi:hypothetical protein